MTGAHFITRGSYLFDGGMHYFASPYFWIPRLIGLVLLVIGIVLIVKAIKKRNAFFIEHNSESIELLKLKYINSEIAEDEYKRKLALLK
jgi:uncharacterized membrane protein